ncbi:hypothetical protein QYF61_011674 [Mycteria americana]|uniref:Uncharacterized protein n=1 Tax=Mycteria americana TaxID=33587 RepID=A0AAN7SHW5_MYCAM|nr:hypothetical protein QYF61_011674 [Mycteria americana]
MITAAQAASNLDITDWLTCVGDHQIRYCIPSGRAVYYLAEEVIINALQESPGLPTACRATFPADVRLCHQVEHIVHPVTPHTAVLTTAIHYQ